MPESKKAFISFPPDSVAEQPLRVPLLLNAGGYFALNKPVGVNGFQERGLGGGAGGIAEDIWSRAAAGAGQFAGLEISDAWPVNFPAREVSGVFLLAKSREARASLKNAMGSGRFLFTYHFLAGEAPEVEQLVCDLPLTSEPGRALAFASRKRGKKTETRFRRLRAWTGGSLWEAVSTYDRLHQVRVHAAESGIRLLGESVYAPPHGRGRSSGRRRREEREVGPDFSLHLRMLDFSDAGGSVRLEAEYPGRFRELLRQMERRRGGKHLFSEKG